MTPNVVADGAKLSEFEILADGSMVTVKFAAENTQDEVVKVWKLGMADMPILANAMGNEASEIAVVTKKPVAWVQGLSDDSFETLIEEGRRLNFTRFSRYWKRQTDLLKAMGQGAAMENAVTKAVEKVLSRADALRV